MTESPSEDSAPPVLAQSWAVRLGFAAIAALTLIVGLAFFDARHRSDLETHSETTAVGDVRFFQPPADLSRLPAVGALLNGQPLYVTETKPIEVRDTHTHRAGRDSERGVAIYELAATATDAERARVGAARRGFLLKTAPGRYVIARPAEGK